MLLNLQKMKHLIRIALMALAALHAPAQITNLTGLGASSTQAVISYTSSDDSPCRVEVSKYPSISATINDLNHNLFPGSDLDDRPGNTSRDQRRTVVIGKRSAETASDGKRYSRALQAATRYYGRIRCGLNVISFEFETETVPYGETYNELIPVDPLKPGETAWPELGWTDRNEEVVDPQSGVLIRKLTFPKMEQIFLSNYNFNEIRGQGWTNQDDVLLDDGKAATYQGTNRDPLFLALDFGFGAANDSTLEPTALSVKLKGSSTTSGEDAKVETALTRDNINPYGKWLEVDLNNCGVGCTVGDDTTSNYLKQLSDVTPAWLKQNQQPLRIIDRLTHRGKVTVTGNQVDYQYPHGDGFNLEWSKGSRFAICNDNSDPCTTGYTTSLIERVERSTRLILSNAPGDFTTPRWYQAPNFGILVRKKTNSNHSLNLQYVGLTSYTSTRPGFNGGSGSTDMCADRLIPGHDQSGKPDGTYGYHCGVLNGYAGDVLILWVNPINGEVRYLGPLWVMNTLVEGVILQAAPCLQSSFTWDTRGPNNALYCLTKTASNQQVLVKATFTGLNRDVGPQPPQGANQSAWTYSLASPGTAPFLIDQITAFEPDWDRTKFPGVGLIGLQNNQLVLQSRRGIQDSYGWNVIYDPIAKQVRAAQNSWKYAPCRWCGIHTTLSLRDAKWLNNQGKFLRGGAGVGTGTYSTTIKTPLLVGPHSDCATQIGNLGQQNLLGVTGNNCSTTTVVGEPLSPTAETYLQDAAVGDVFQVHHQTTGAYDQEVVRLVARNGLQWVLERGYSTERSSKFHGTGTILIVQCAAIAFKAYVGDGVQAGIPDATWWWDWEKDPHGKNAADPLGLRSPGATVLADLPFPNGHPTYYKNTYIVDGGAAGNQPELKMECRALPFGLDSGYSLRTKEWPDHVRETKVYCVNGNPTFSGEWGAGYGNYTEKHPSHGGDNWFSDARPLNTNTDFGFTATHISGQLYRLTNFAPQQPSWKKHQWATSCGHHSLKDVSGPTLGDTISDDATNSYTTCTSQKVGECRTTSQPNEIYVNCPSVAPNPNGWTKEPVGEFHCGQKGTRYQAHSNDICTYPMGAHSDTLGQYLLGKMDIRGRRIRNLGKVLNVPKGSDPLWNARNLPDGSWVMSPNNLVNGTRYENLLIKIPPFGYQDSTNRADFLPYEVSTSVPSGAGITTALAEFGYDQNFYCGPRREKCIAYSKDIPLGPNPYVWESQTHLYSGVPCTTGCTITIPTIAGRILYYRVVYRDGNNQIVEKSDIRIIR